MKGDQMEALVANPTPRKLQISNWTRFKSVALSNAEKEHVRRPCSPVSGSLHKTRARIAPACQAETMREEGRDPHPHPSELEGARHSGTLASMRNRSVQSLASGKFLERIARRRTL